jgi:predicted O-linked N-acetylglucosamine transferase (SPINDLY family)/predicted SAM-dependent methyltransferase
MSVIAPPALKAAQAPTATPEATMRGQHLTQALVLQQQGRTDEAAVLFRTVLADHPDDAVALYSLTALLMQTGGALAAGDVLGYVEHGVKVAPQFAPLWFAHGVVLHALGRRDEALASYDEAIRLKPDYAEALLNSGALLRELQRHLQALERFNQVLANNPAHESALGNAAILLTEFKQSDQAIAMFERLLKLNPDYPYGPGLLNYERMHACDWTDFEQLSAQIKTGLREGRKVTKTLGLMAISDSASDHFLAARIFASQWFPKAPSALWNGERYAHAKIRIAYVSPDLREHPVGHLTAGIFERHDKSRFETIAISLGIDDQSRLRARMLQSFDRFIDARGMGARQIAELMREIEVDIAIDLAGYTSDSRIDIFAHRPSPLAITWLGYPGTLATDYFDHILADRHVIPPEHDAFYSENVVRLPHTYLPTDPSIAIAAETPTREACGLPATGPVLCSFSHDYKIHPAMFAAWMRILQQLSGSVLWLVSRNALSQANLRRAAEAQGVDPSRLIFAQRVPRVEDHLARYRLADVFLDTTPYNAHTTAADALMAGLPVVTCMGNAFPARVAGSLLHAIGLPELITRTLADYETLVVDLVSDRPRLADVKARLAANRTTQPLFDSAGFCRDLEATLIRLYDQCQKTIVKVTPPALPATPLGPRRLHIGGKTAATGWEILNAIAAPGVDHLGNANDLSRFPDGTFDTIYASHVVEHFDYQKELGKTLTEWQRVLKPGGSILVSVPDLEVLAGLLLDKSLTPVERFMVMRMMFGGHMDDYDYHYVGLTEEFLRYYLTGAGFDGIQRVESFGHFEDTSELKLRGRSISLNVRATKPVRA